MKKEPRNMSDKELDDFIRQNAENPDIPYHLKDWEKMNGKLDHYSRTGSANGSGRGYNGWWIGLLAFMIFVGAGLGWKFLVHDPDKTGNSVDQPNTTRKLGQLKMPTKEVASMNSIEEGENIELSEVKTGQLKATATPTSGQRIEMTANAIGPDEKIHEANEGTNRKAGVTTPMTSKPEEGYAISKMYSRIQSYKDHFAKSILSGRKSAAPNMEKIIPSLQGLQNEERAVADSNKEKTGRVGDKFSISVSVAPDVTALKIKDVEGLGTSIGFNLEYFIQPNLSINTGALYAFKTYRGGEGYYTGYTPAPSSISGDCWILDSPLNVRYYVMDQALGRWFISGGLSSYLMLREKYGLDYNSYGNTYEKRVDVRNNNQHYLGIMNFSLGYERVLTERIAIQVEPYLKVPIKGIGEGRISLKSAGALIGLKYHW